MGEIDTKPIESVRTALSLFGEKGDHHRISRSTGSDDEKERELENVLKDLANYKVQAEAREAAYKQALLNLEHSQKMEEELSTLLRNSVTERERYENECIEARDRIRELESETKDMADQLLESTKIHEQLPFVWLDHETMKGELICRETEVEAAIKESEIEALKQAEKCEELNKRVFGLDEAIRVSEKEKNGVVLEKDAEIELAKKAHVEAEERVEDMRTEMEGIIELENQLLFKSIFVETLQLLLEEANEQISFTTKSVSDAITDLSLLHEKLEMSERKISSQEALIEAFKMEMNELKIELKNANRLASHLTYDVEMLTGDLVRAKSEIDEAREREKAAQAEIALLKSKSDTDKKESEMLDQPAEKPNEVDSTQFDKLDTETKDSFKHTFYQANGKASPEIVTKDSSQITWSENKELENLRNELDAAMAKVAEFRNRAEQATCRAEMAESAKTAIEDQLRKWREERQKRKLALATPKEVSEANEFSIHRIDDKPPQSTHYLPLYKVLKKKL